MKARVLNKIKAVLTALSSIETRVFYALSYLFGSLAFLFTFRRITLIRVISALKDLFTSIAYWFVYIFDDWYKRFLGEVPEIEVTLRELPDIDFLRDYLIDPDFFDKILSLKYYAFDPENFIYYNRWLLWFISKNAYYICNYSLIFVLALICFKELMLFPNGLPLGAKSSCLNRFERLWRKLHRVIEIFKEFFDYLYYNVFFKYCIFFVLMLSFNVFTFIFEFFAFYYYFISSLDIVSFLPFFLKVLLDAFITLSCAGVFFWIPLLYLIFDDWRRKKGYELLRKHEAKNCAFCKSTNICSLIVASMRKGKTAFMTDMKLSWVNIHKRQMRDVLHKYDLMFPFFPWESFEADLKELKVLGLLKTPAHQALFVDTKMTYFDNAPCPEYLYGYDYKTFGLEKNVGNKIMTIREAMTTYAKAYCVYINENLDHSNYPIRFDGKFTASKYLPKWQGDFFEIEPGENESRYSHIIVHDVFRQGKKVDPNNKHNGALTVGSYGVMEFGKSQKNQIGLEGVDINAAEANQKNDKYDYSLYMLGHAEVMIDNICVANFLADDQRPMSIPAKLRDCFSIITLVSKSDVQLALPCFWVEEWVYDHVYEPFKAFYEDYRDKRGDRTAPSMLLKLAVAAFSNYYSKIYNTFGYFEYDVALESGTAYGQGSPADTGPEMHKYYIAFKKTFSDRYKTDGMSQFFNKRLLDCESPLDDVPCYSSLNMTIEEMEYQTDYFTNEMLTNIYGDVEGKQDPAPTPRKKQRKTTSDMSDIIYNNIGSK